MTASYLINIPKTNLKLKKVNDFSKSIFIDNSGSTTGQLVHVGKDILKAELSICQDIKFDNIILWNSSAEICKDIKSARSTGGTDPQAIFKNGSTKEAFNTSDVIVFVTDGEIDNSSVTQFSTYLKDNLNKALIISVIVNKKLADPSKINVSVVAPLMVGGNVLCLFYDGQTFYVLSSKGYISNFYKSPDNLTDYKYLNTLNMKELFNNLDIYEYAKIPDGYISIRDDEEEILALDFNKFMSVTDLDAVKQIGEEEWKTLIQYGKIGNKLAELRTFVTQMKNTAVRSDMATIKTKFNFKYSKQRDDIVAKIVALKADPDADAEQLAAFRKDLHEISDKAKVEELEYIKYVNSNLHTTRQFWNNIQNMIHEQEVGSYSINDFSFASNRANRAKTVTENDDDYGDTLNVLDHSGVPNIECAICMEQGPAVLWLKSPANLDDSTSDYAINFPLQRNDSLRNCIVSNPVCGSCANPYMNATTAGTGELITLYRETCSGFIPLKWSSVSNQRYSKYILYRTLAGNKVLHHVSMLLLAIVDDHKSDWFDEQVKAYLIKQIAENIYTTDSFTEEGTRMTFVNAIREVIKQEDKLMRQPFTAVCRILNLNRLFHKLDTDNIIQLLRKRFFLTCIETQCNKSKYGPEHLAIVKTKLYDTIFYTFCGIPLQGSFKQVNFDDQKLKEFLGNTYDSYLDTVTKLAVNIGSECSVIFPGKVISYILYLLTTVEIHDRPMKLYTAFALQHKMIRDMNVDWNAATKSATENVFRNSHKLSKILIPAYAINLGRFSCPSKFFFHTKPLWSSSVENKRVNITALMNEVKTNLDKELKEANGSVAPNNQSAHFPLHLIVAEVLTEKYANVDNITDEMVMDCMVRMARTAGKKGNIYAEYVFNGVAVTIVDYLKFRKETKNWATSNELECRSYQYKVIAELKSCGMDYNENTEEVLFKPSLFKVPHMLDVYNSDIDLIDLKKRVQDLYTTTNTAAAAANDIDRACVNIEIKDFIEFGYNMDTNALLPIWAREQQNIVSTIVTDTDQIEQPIKYVAGLDISFVKTNDKAVASMVIFDYLTLNIVAKISVNCNMKIPYVAGYLAFREAPVFMKIIDIVKENCPELIPQVILMDGNGIWHPRRAGIASHFGVLSDIPCFGVTKNVLVADGVTQESVEKLLIEHANKENEFVEVKGDSGAVLGLAYNVTGFVKNAVYISAGHKITLQTAKDIFKTVTKYRITEPIRQADLLSRKLVAELE
ncbi:unnamed protein product [Didymodactylos carnosus]|uniref:Endonuclease V n=1 Tax=Didymodactylos carnosus TaxID=1234261 RepID=A0A814R6Y9_9BILA|nr:unnamed protein product [Didymodactylos carnosus]CAF1129758.1 unnamed protein product [Didymodactylos carnosus]CAF3588032.1 unnamed protein product [Didymodactylos carnosus]CAF3893471.1 unnamed protein product [Didymodactylos carnosus]